MSACRQADQLGLIDLLLSGSEQHRSSLPLPMDERGGGGALLLISYSNGKTRLAEAFAELEQQQRLSGPDQS